MLPADRSDKGARRRIGRYTVVGRIGRGGMGMVYRGWDDVLEREVAVKTLTVEGTLDAESRQRFQIEAKAAARLQHANIVTVFELGEDRGVPYIAMELLPGVDLETLMRSGEPLLLEEKLEVMVQVLRGLHFAHEHGIVHRDIKPSNIRLLEDGAVKIMDFGIAKLGGTGVTKTGMMVGTVHYMSPEQIRGKPLDGRSDVFSAGVILHELLCGRRPFVADTPTAVLFKIINDPAPPLEPALVEAAPELPPIVAQALAKDAGSRFPSAMKMGEELQAVATRLRGPASAAPPDVIETVDLSRRLIKEGRLDDALKRLRDAAERYPRSLEARRALRTATRERERRLQPRGGESEEFPELDLTYQAAPTRRTPDTVTAPSVAALDTGATVASPAAGASAARSSARALQWAGAVALLVAVIAGGLLMTRRAPVAARVRVRSEPSGASVFLDGRDTGVVTDGEISLPPGASGMATLTLRKPAYRDASRVLRLPLTADEVRVELELLPVAAASPPVATDPSAAPVPQGRVAVSASYPLDIQWRGRSVGHGPASAEVSLPAGRQSLTLVAPVYFLRQTVTVDVRPPAVATVEAPPLGKINIRANPDNCQVFIDGVFVEYPPILDRAITVGGHKVGFKWPDGAHQEESIEVPRGGPAYVTGRKD